MQLVYDVKTMWNNDEKTLQTIKRFEDRKEADAFAHSCSVNPEYSDYDIVISAVIMNDDFSDPIEIENK